MKTVSSAVLLILLLHTSLLAAPQVSTIAGQITDSLGAAIANARVFIHWDESGSAIGLSDNVGSKNDLMVTTDAKGKYQVVVPSGFYDVFVSSPGFTPSCAKVRVKSGQRVAFNAKLVIAPAVVEELGDEIPVASGPR